VIIGNNAGAPGDVELRYAHDDADKLFGVLTTLGGFAPESVTLLTERTADDVRRALITINDRIRAHGSDDVLFVYYSGHASADELHLGRTTLAFDQLASLVRGSAAAMRILVVDACRSGSLTHVKGGS
jgi:caspase domain-containing protein